MTPLHDQSLCIVHDSMPQGLIICNAQVLDLAKEADGLKEELLDLAAQANPLAAAQAAKQPSGLPAEQSHSVELPSTAKRQSELLCPCVSCLRTAVRACVAANVL